MRYAHRFAGRPWFALLLSALALGLSGCGPKLSAVASVASVEVVRTPVELEGSSGHHPVSGEERTQAGQKIVVADKAQALLHHDVGARLLIDGGGEVEVTASGIKLLKGRLWVDANGGRVEVESGVHTLLASSAGFEVTAADSTRLSVIRGEVAFVGKGRGVVHAGEQLILSGDAPKQGPIALWDDWTGGLGWPDPRVGHGAPGLGEVGARKPGDLGQARFPLSLNRLEVQVRVEDDLAITTVEETFFNPADATLEGIFRVRLPEDAILSRFAIDRRGRYVDGYVKERETARRDYESKVYEGSTHDPALLEWEAPGQFKARLYPLPPGSTRKVLYTYSQWLPLGGPANSLRTYRFPMGAAAGAGAPIIQELNIEVDASRAAATEVRAGLGAVLSEDGKRVVLQRTDYVPSADLVVELVGAARPQDVARVYRVSHEDPPRPGGRTGKPEDDYVLIRTLPSPMPTASARAPIDLALLVDVSAATDATHLSMARTLIESVLRRLGPDDRVVLLGADLDAHAVGAAKSGKKDKPALPTWSALNQETTQKLLEQLGRVTTGGATDLGRTLSEAGAMLAPDRLGAVLYVGDGKPTVGELSVKSLRERLSSLPQPLRLYAVGVGDDANLDLLSSLSDASAGQAFRVGDRKSAAETALRVVTHLGRPAVSKLQVAVGSSLDRVYPRETVAVRAGEPLLILARLKKRLPQSITVEGVELGQAFVRTYRLEGHNLDNTSDLRLRWSQARLGQLLESGATVEEVAELGVRQNLITPYTSYYVPSEEEVSALERAIPEVRAAGCSRSPMSFSKSESASAPAPASSVAVSGEAPQVADAPGSASEGAMGGKQRSKNRRTASRDRGEGGSEDAKAMPADDEAPPPPPAAAAMAPAKPSPSMEKAEAAYEERERAPAKKSKRASNKDSDKLDLPDVDGDAYGGAAGFGLVGSGKGGGGVGEGTIGLGNLGTIGHGSGGGYGSDGGYGAKTGALRSRKGSAPEVAMGTAEVTGSLDKELIRRIIRRHINEIKFCQEREVVRGRPGRGRVLLRFTIGPEGSVLQSIVQSSTVGNPAIEQCMAQAVRRWEFPKPRGGGIVSVVYPFVLTADSPTAAPLYAEAPRPAVEISTPDVTVVVGIITHRPKGCSAASTQPLDERRQLWKERLSGGVRKALEVLQDAVSGCEVRRWSERRELLKLMLRHVGGPSGMVELHNTLSEEPDDQDYLRHAILGEVKNPRDLKVVYDGLGLGDEERAMLAQEVVAKAKSLPDRLLRLEELLAKWPGDLKLRILRMETEESLGEAESARRTAEEVRMDPYADAQARTSVGELFVRLGDEVGARRAFSEIVEFAPQDPLARRRLGDLYRAHGWYDEAYRQYETLLQLQPGDNAVLILQALAAAGAGKIEEALGLEKRVVGDAEPGSESGLAKVALLWSSLRLAELREQARTVKGKDTAEELALLNLRARQSGIEGLYRPVRVLLTWAHPEADLDLRVAAPGESAGPAMDLAPQFGLLGWHSHKDATPKGEYLVEVRRQDRARAIGYDVVLTVVVAEGQKDEQLHSSKFKLAGELAERRFLLRDGRLLPQ
jgi:TonB family protein